MFDPQDPSMMADPYPHYARLRKEAPVLWLPDDDMWVVSRYEDVCTVLRNPGVFSSRLGLAAPPGRTERARTGIHFRLGAPGVRLLIALDPPEHAVFRRAVAALFNAKGVARLRARVEDVARAQVGRLLDRAAHGTADFYADVAEPVPAHVLAELFGLPIEMRAELRRWAQAITADLDAMEIDDGSLGRGLEMLRFFRKEIIRRRGGDGEDLLDLLAHSGARGLTDSEILSFCGFLVVAGVETTTNQLTNLMDVLVHQPEIQTRLRRNPVMIPAAVEESVRYDAAVQGLWRSTNEEATLAGRRLPAGARLFVLFASANRDEEHFADADRFLLDRTLNDHVGFGHGIHYCLGARLARLEIESVLRELFRRTGWISAGEKATRVRSVALRGFSRQDVTVVPA
jgi:cytochrome P450